MMRDLWTEANENHLTTMFKNMYKKKIPLFSAIKSECSIMAISKYHIIVEITKNVTKEYE